MSVELRTALSLPPRRRRWRWQWSLTTLLLLMAAIAAWTAWFGAKRKSDRLRAEIATMEQLSRRFKVDDASQFAVVEKTEMWYDDDRWEVYLPEENVYVIKLVTRGIYGHGFPEAAWQQAIPPGRHEITWISSVSSGTAGAKIIVSVDGEPLIEGVEDAQWVSHTGWSAYGSYDRVTQFSVTKPLELQRRQFTLPLPGGSTSVTSGKPAMGVLLWIEKSDGR